jgi:colicin import membrane protein
LYRLEVAFQIQKNWAFNEQLAGDDQSLVAAIVFKVMPDGEIRDIFFTDRSGNTYLDESAYKAIVKSNPVDAHPSGLAQPYVVMAIRFTPQGIR